MIQRLYFQCGLGHYSAGDGGCYFDDWSPEPPTPTLLRQHDESKAFTRMRDLRQSEYPPDALRHLILFDFGSPEAVFDGMVPLGWISRAHEVKLWSDRFPDGLDVAAEARAHLYFRCNGGQYFTESVQCPLDGWSHKGIKATMSAFREATAAGAVPRPADVVPTQFAAELLPRTMVAQFGDSRRAAYGICPMIYHHRGETYLAKNNIPEGLL